MAEYVTEKVLHQTKSSLEPVEFFTFALRCPLCNAEFTCEVPGINVPPERDTDLRPRYGTIDPLPSVIHSCPSCRYTAYREGYSSSLETTEQDIFEPVWQLGDRPPTRFMLPNEDDSDDLRRWIRDGGLTQKIPLFREPFGAHRYLLGARCFEFLKEDEPLGVADLFLRASWCARTTDDRELERFCQYEAINRFELAIEQDLLLEADCPRTLYLIGELLRRTGEFSRAVDHFSQMESLVDLDEDEGYFFLSLAKRQILLAMVKSSVNGFFEPGEIQKVERGRML